MTLIFPSCNLSLVASSDYNEGSGYHKLFPYDGGDASYLALLLVSNLLLPHVFGPKHGLVAQICLIMFAMHVVVLHS